MAFPRLLLVAALCSSGVAARRTYAEVIQDAVGYKAAEADREGDPTPTWPGSEAVGNTGYTAKKAASDLSTLIEKRLEKVLDGTFTHECVDRVLGSFLDHTTKFITEDFMPWERQKFASQCKDDSKGKYSASSPSARGAPRRASADVRLAYVLTVHDKPYQVKRLVGALEEEAQHSFVIHVDGKHSAASTFDDLVAWSADRPHVHVMHEHRHNVTWGGFNVVQATLDAITYVHDNNLPYDWIINLSGATYPLASNERIRSTLAAYPVDSVFLEVRGSPNHPATRTWHNFEECDNAMRRIWRLPEAHGINMYVGSQWMVIPKGFVHYLATDTSFVSKYIMYGKHTMVADENFFATVLKNSPYCDKHVSDNFCFVQFDQWEHAKDDGPNQDKCLQPNPKHCGRSPVLHTIETLPVLEMSNKLFARKFDPAHDSEVLDAIDARRAPDATGGPARKKEYLKSVLFKQAAGDGHLCLAGGKAMGKLRLETCDAEAKDQRFTVGPCSPGGSLTLDGPDAPLVGHAQDDAVPYCPLRSGMRQLCLDLEGESVKEGTAVISYPCTGKWNQLFTFGLADDPDLAGHVYVRIPYTGYDPKELCITAATDGAAQTRRCRAGDKSQLFVATDLAEGAGSDDAAAGSELGSAAWPKTREL